MFVDVPGKLPYLRRHYESSNSSIGVEGLQATPLASPWNRNIDPRSAPADGSKMRSAAIRIAMTLKAGVDPADACSWRWFGNDGRAQYDREGQLRVGKSKSIGYPHSISCITMLSFLQYSLLPWLCQLQSFPHHPTLASSNSHQQPQAHTHSQ